MKKSIKVFLIIIASLAVIIYGGVFLGHKVFFTEETSNVPTIEAVANDKFILGVQAHPVHPATLDAFIPVLAEQLRRHNEIAPELWPGNPLVNQSLIVEGLRSKKFWLISPDGSVTPLKKDDALSYGFTRNAYVDGFSFFDGGMYYAYSDEDLTNYLKWQKYLHLGTHDASLFVTHEGFHRTQSNWQVMNEVSNRGRNEFLENIPARAKRTLLQKQILAAVNNPGDKQLILEALATYADWKTQFPDDYHNSIYFERIEGTANYYEYVTGLYMGYPDQIKNSMDLDSALALLASREDIYVGYGLIRECYTVSGFACVLLDRLESDWKERLMDDPYATPIEMLYQHFINEPLPEPKQITQSEIDAVAEEIQKLNVSLVLPRLFRLFYDILF
ncbi:MAG: hypothetical protein FWG91_03905 [Lachnospiraceae bacterium]|nr:hypothetical protein [Lachnospiraceae bacterium]